MAIDLIKPGVSTAEVCSVLPKAEEFGFPDEMAAFGLQFGHGLGLNLHERPIVSRVVSMDHPTVIKEGMVFALETYCPASDGYSAARIEEEIVVTDKGHTADLAVPGGGIADRGAVLNHSPCATWRKQSGSMPIPPGESPAGGIHAPARRQPEPLGQGYRRSIRRASTTLCMGARPLRHRLRCGSANISAPHRNSG